MEWRVTLFGCFKINKWKGMEGKQSCLGVIFREMNEIIL